ncbi:DUF1211 domain-containing protein [Lysobacter oculi]|uniref:DUF1211 domain-containing protein n=1 Tax=Solilutibacter oculi TaxID=2698682 RepID=A0A344J5A7_9GAMM|nr:TMEM175 family protein [Lysobacter oculi]AXA84217.1 DUF1211 domain-containing protein [Lysobacter oculi]
MSDPVTRQESYPHDRAVFFSDAVFAIAMTLLAIEFRAPTHELVERVGAGQAWAQMIPLFIAYVISFLVLGLYWAGHMQAWKYVTHVGPKLVWLNIMQLMFVALVPFGTSQYSEAFFQDMPVAFMAYCAILSGIALFSVLERRAIAAQEGLAAKLGVPDTRWFQLRSLVPLIVFMAGIPMSAVLPNWAGGWWFMLIWPLSWIARRWVFRAEPVAHD